MKNTTTKIIIVTICLVLLVIPIYVIFSGLIFGAFYKMEKELENNGRANIYSSWDVKITDIKTNTLKDAKLCSAPSYDFTTATFDVELTKPGAKAEFYVTVENNGTIDAVLEKSIDLSAVNKKAPKEVVYTIDAVKGDELKAKSGDTASKKVYKVTIERNDTQSVSYESKRKSATINLNFVQK